MCCIFCVISIVLGLGGTAASQSSQSVEGCVAVAGQSCSYQATRPGGVAGVGDAWKVQIVRDGQILYVKPGSAPRANVIKPGDNVRAWAGMAGATTSLQPTAGLVRVGPNVTMPTTGGSR